jgi:hypothetical protein
MSANFLTRAQRVIQRILPVAALILLLASGCGSTAENSPADEGGVTPYGSALEKARDASSKADQRSREVEEEIQRQEQGY